MIPATFELDDFPRGRVRVLDFLDAARTNIPDFKATLFAVPEWMTEADWAAVEARRSWIEVGMHGFAHARTGEKVPECVEPKLYRRKLRWLDELAMPGGPWTARLFKAPWWTYSEPFLHRFIEHAGGAAGLAIDHLEGFPMPLTGDLARLPVWRPKDWLWRRGWLGANDYHAHAHPPELDNPGCPRAKRTAMEPKRCGRWLAAWRAFSEPTWDFPATPWAFASRLTRPLLTKVSLGCGRRKWPGWLALDAVPSRQGVQGWRWPDPIPVTENAADVILISHFLNYLDPSEYVPLFLECWRVLRPGGVLRVSEDDCSSGRRWKAVGDIDDHGLPIKSEPTRATVTEALTRVGFRVFGAEPGWTHSPHRDVLKDDSRKALYDAGQKFYVEGIKAIEIPVLHRPSDSDTRRQRNGTYRLP